MTEYLVVLVTTADEEEGKQIAETLVSEHLAACINMFPANSIYRWQGKIEKAQEFLLLIKTQANLFEKLKKRVESIHSYTVPEIIALPIVKGKTEYLNWIKEETQE